MEEQGLQGRSLRLTLQRVGEALQSEIAAPLSANQRLQWADRPEGLGYRTRGTALGPAAVYRPWRLAWAEQLPHWQVTEDAAGWIHLSPTLGTVLDWLQGLTVGPAWLGSATRRWELPADRGYPVCDRLQLSWAGFLQYSYQRCGDLYPTLLADRSESGQMTTLPGHKGRDRAVDASVALSPTTVAYVRILMQAVDRLVRYPHAKTYGRQGYSLGVALLEWQRWRHSLCATAGHAAGDRAVALAMLPATQAVLAHILVEGFNQGLPGAIA